MASNDIELNLDLVPKLNKKDLAEVTKALSSVRRQLESEFRAGLNKVISPGSFSGLSYGYEAQKHMADMRNLISDNLAAMSNFFLSGARVNKNRKRGITGEDAGAFNVAFNNAHSAYLRMQQSLDRFEPLLQNINFTEGIFTDVKRGLSTHQTNVGRTRLARRRFNKLYSLAERTGLGSDPFLAAMQQGIEATNQLAKRPRASYTEETLQDYSEAATQAVFDLLFDKSTSIDALNKIGLGVTKAGGYGKNVDPKIQKAVAGMISAIDQMPALVEKLNDPWLSQKDKNPLMEVYKQLKKDFNKGIKVIAATPEARQVAIEQFARVSSLNTNGSTLFGQGGPLSRGTIVSGLAASVEAMLTAKWEADVGRSAFTTRAAQAQEITSLGKIIGGILGGLIGFGVSGNPVVGATTAIAGSDAGGLFGAYTTKRLAANLESIKYTTNQIKSEALFGRGYSQALAAGIQEQGIASQQSVQNMANNAMTFRARMMLGMVGEDEMLMYSFMPEYLNYLMSASNPTLGGTLTSYAKSVRGIPDASLRALAGQTVGGGSADLFALANTPYFEQIMRLAPYAQHVDEIARMYSEGIMMAGSTTRPAYNMDYTLAQILKSAQSTDAFVTHPAYLRPYDRDYERQQNIVDNSGRSTDFLHTRVDEILQWGSTPVNINIYVEGELIKSEMVMKSDMLNSGNLLRVGGQ